MTFEEWEWENRKIVDDLDVPSDVFRACWDAAVAAEREACAKLCEGKDEGAIDGLNIGHAFARAIRERPNMELRGATDELK